VIEQDDLETMIDSSEAHMMRYNAE